MAATNAEFDHELCLAPDAAGQRLDRALADALPAFSRAQLTRWLAAGALAVDGRTVPAKTRVRGGERVTLSVPEDAHATAVRPQPIELDVVYVDAAILVINKPAGLVMHPGAGNADGTLANALVYFDPAAAQLPRAGIVHRLDKDTSGLCVVARTGPAHRALVAALAKRRVTREYEAIVAGVPIAGGHVDAPIGRHPVHRTRMAVRDNGRPALTHYRVAERYPAHARVHCRLESGRTHQIRVHLAHIGYPLVGDPAYGGRLAVPKQSSDTLTAALRGFRRQALHARVLGLDHPRTGESLQWTAPRPPDLNELIDALSIDRQQHAARESDRPDR